MEFCVYVVDLYVEFVLVCWCGVVDYVGCGVCGVYWCCVVLVVGVGVFEYC